MSESNKNVSLATTVLGVVAALLFVAVTGIFLQGWTLRRMVEEESRKIFERPYPELQAYEAEQEQELTAGYYWLDEKAGTVHLPIERAMELIVAEYSHSDLAEEDTADDDAAQEDGQ